VRYELLRRTLVVLVAGLLFPAVPFSETNSSHVPPARFTAVKGKVMVRSPGASANIRAAAYAAIEQGLEVSTAEGGSATVAFKDGSTIQLRELGKIEFTSLAAGANSPTEITLKEGFASFRILAERQDAYSVKVSNSTLIPHGVATFQTVFAKRRVQLGVQAGAVTVAAQSRSMVVRKGQAMEFDPFTAEELPTSHVRVVRLSFVSGTVSVSRPGSPSPEKAPVNMPLQEGFELSTSGASYAEVEFENGSATRLGELSKLKFYELGLGDSGDKLNGLSCEQGYATFHFLPEQYDALHVKVGDATLTPHGKSEFRTDIEQDRYRVEVFSGSVNVDAAGLSADLGPGKALERQVGSTELAFNIRKRIMKDAWDRWSDARDNQVDRTIKDQPVGPSGMRAGWSDLDTYGEWVQIAGRGIGWSPYAQAGWSPYTQGSWGWYPGTGWTWISSEPWGWLPYHCGFWDLDPAFGWYWSLPVNGCMFWEPSRVYWYSVPNWIGWWPRGRGTPGTLRPPTGAPGHPPGHPRQETPTHLSFEASRHVIAVPMGVFQHQQMITPQTAHEVLADPSSMIERPTLEPSSQTARELTAAAAGARSTQPGHGDTAIAATAPNSSGKAGVGFAQHSTAPSTLLMGGDPARENTLLSGYRIHSGREPLRAREGLTLGGRYNVRGSTGEFRGEAFRGWQANGTSGFRGIGSGAISVSHQSGGGAAHGGWTGGSAAGVSVSGGHMSGGSAGGFSGGHSSAASSGGGYSGGGGGGHSGGGGGGGGGHH